MREPVRRSPRNGRAENRRAAVEGTALEQSDPRRFMGLFPIIRIAARVFFAGLSGRGFRQKTVLLARRRKHFVAGAGGDIRTDDPTAARVLSSSPRRRAAFDQRYPVIGAWMRRRRTAGIGIREDVTPITTTAASLCRIISIRRSNRNYLAQSRLIGVGAHLLYFAVAIGAIILFVAIYTAITPYWEIRLIRQGNTPCDLLRRPHPGLHVSARAVRRAKRQPGDMLLWSAVAWSRQLVAYA